MQRIRLLPARREPPRCESFDDESVVRAFECAVRVHRAWTEPYALERDEARVDDAWRVTSSSGGTYVVDVVDGSAAHDACSCPDYLGNDLGTCKHLEAVRRAIETRPALRRAYRALGRTPATPTLTVVARGGLALRALGRFDARTRAAVGLAVAGGGALEVRDPARVVAGRHDDDAYRVVHAAVVAAARLHASAALAQRRDEVARAFARGALGVDVLRHALFPYQRDGVRHLVAAGRALLADDMGLGKTVQAIAACEVLRARGEASRVLIVTAASLKDQWAGEIARYTDERAVVVGGDAAARRSAIASDAPYKVLNYELTWRELGELQALDADVLVLDEAQRAKNFRTRTAATLRAIPSRFAFVLTGTPVENRLDDLYALMQLVDPGRLGPLWRFNLAFGAQNPNGRIRGYKNLAALRATLAPVVLRRRKDDVLTQLPPVTEQTRYSPLTPRQVELERAYRADASVLLSIAERRGLRLEEQQRLQMLLLKARQACNAVELCDPGSKVKGSPKLDEFEALISEVTAQGTSKVLVFSEWLGMLKLAARRLDTLGVKYATLHGGVPSEKRPALLERFREDADTRVLLSTDAGGVGLNLQVATYVVHLDLPWNPARLDQRTARAHRLGQTRGVSVTYLCAATGIERGIEGTLAGKRAVRAAALDAGSAVDALEVQSFTGFLRRLRETLDAVAAPPTANEARAADEAVDAVDAVEPVTLPAEPHAMAALEGATRDAAPDAATTGDAGAPSAAPGAAAGAPRALNRLRLARVVLDAGFASDAVRAAYEALASAVASLLEGPAPASHAALVAAIYRDLIPRGRLASSTHHTLAQLHDLSTLDAQGVDVDPALARQAVDDAGQQVARVGTAPGSP